MKAHLNIILTNGTKIAAQSIVLGLTEALYAPAGSSIVKDSKTISITSISRIEVIQPE